MANRFTNISTSSFKPLSLDEIMAVPLAKQAQHDASMLALDEFSKMEANSLDQDKEYVTGQIQAFQQESDQLSNQLLESGVDRNLKNKLKALRNRKNQEFSLQGKTGQASAAYNEYKANEASIMARKDLDAEQKRRGLEKAKYNYQGVVNGGKYENYVGTSRVDVMKRGLDMAQQMDPQEVAKIIGMEYDPSTGFYTDGTYITKELTPDHIAKVVYQGLKNDQLVGSYMGELQDLGIEPNVDKALMDVATTAGNIYQQNNKKTSMNYRGGGAANAKKETVDPSRGRIETRGWRTRDILSDAGAIALNNQYDILPIEVSSQYFQNGQLIDFQAAEPTERQAKNIEYTEELYAKQKASYEAGNTTKEQFDKHTEVYERNSDRLKNQDTKEFNKIQKDVKRLRDTYTSLSGSDISDQEVYEALESVKEEQKVRYAEVFNPPNPKNTYKVLEEDLIGSGEKNGSFASSNVVMPGMKSGGTRLMAEQLGMNMIDFNAMIRNTGQRLGFSPGLVDMPGASAVQFEFPEGHDREGESDVLYVQADNNTQKQFESIGSMNDAQQSGTPYSVKQKSPGLFEHTISDISVRRDLEGNPIYDSESAVIRSPIEISKEELERIDFELYSPEELKDFGIDSSTPIYYAEHNGNPVFRLTYDQEMQRVTNIITDTYDATPNEGQNMVKDERNR